MTTAAINSSAPADPAPALVTFFKSLSDVHRLQVAGRLAAGNQTVAQLAEALGEPPAAIRKHLDALAAAGLVAGPVDAAQRYRLCRDHIHALAAQVLTRPPVAVPETDDEFAAKVLRDFLTPEGTFRELPAQEKKFLVLVRQAGQVFELGRRYSEKEVNDALRRLHPDTATLRRALIDHQWMQREADGATYWRSDS